MVVFPIPHPTNNTVPTGGVVSPMQRLRTIIIPKCSGVIPSAVTTGKKIGVKIRTAGVISMKVPTNRRIRLMNRRIMNLLSVTVYRLILQDHKPALLPSGEHLIKTVGNLPPF